MVDSSDSRVLNRNNDFDWMIRWKPWKVKVENKGGDKEKTTSTAKGYAWLCCQEWVW